MLPSHSSVHGITLPAVGHPGGKDKESQGKEKADQRGRVRALHRARARQSHILALCRDHTTQTTTRSGVPNRTSGMKKNENGAWKSVGASANCVTLTAPAWRSSFFEAKRMVTSALEPSDGIASAESVFGLPRHRGRAES